MVYFHQCLLHYIAPGCNVPCRSLLIIYHSIVKHNTVKHVVHSKTVLPNNDEGCDIYQQNVWSKNIYKLVERKVVYSSKTQKYVLKYIVKLPVNTLFMEENIAF